MAQPPPSALRARRTGLTLTALMAGGLGATAFVHFTPSVLSPFLIDDLGWDRWQIGALLTAFSLTGAAGSPVMGRYADRIGGRSALIVLYSANTLGLLLFAAAPGFVPMLGVMLLAGLAASAANPSTNKLISAHVAPERRGLVMGVKQSGGPVGIAIVGLLPLLAGAVGWRWAALAATTLPAAGLIAAAVLIPPDPGPARHDIAATRTGSTPLVGWLALQGALIGAGTGGLIAFLPLYAEESLGFSPSRAGMVATAFGALSVAGRVIWGRQRRKFADVGIPLRIITAAAAVVPLLLWLATHTSSALLWVGVAVGGLSFMAWNVFAMLAVVEGVPHHAAGRASGDVTMGYLAGFTPAPILFGLLVDGTGSYGWGWLAIGVIFVAGALTNSGVRRALAA